MQRLKVLVDSVDNPIETDKRVIGRKMILGQIATNAANSTNSASPANININRDNPQLVLNCYSQKILVGVSHKSYAGTDMIYASSVTNITNKKQYKIFGIESELSSITDPTTTDFYGVALFRLCNNNTIIADNDIGNNSTIIADNSIIRYNTYIAISDKGYLFRITSKGVYCKELEHNSGHLVGEYTTDGMLTKDDFIPFSQVTIKK